MASMPLPPTGPSADPAAGPTVPQGQPPADTVTKPKIDPKSTLGRFWPLMFVGLSYVLAFAKADGKNYLESGIETAGNMVNFPTGIRGSRQPSSVKVPLAIKGKVIKSSGSRSRVERITADSEKTSTILEKPGRKEKTSSGQTQGKRKTKGRSAMGRKVGSEPNTEPNQESARQSLSDTGTISDTRGQ